MLPLPRSAFMLSRCPGSEHHSFRRNCGRKGKREPTSASPTSCTSWELRFLVSTSKRTGVFEAAVEKCKYLTIDDGSFTRSREGVHASMFSKRLHHVQRYLRVSLRCCSVAPRKAVGDTRCRWTGDTIWELFVVCVVRRKPDFKSSIFLINRLVVSPH